MDIWTGFEFGMGFWLAFIVALLIITVIVLLVLFASYLFGRSRNRSRRPVRDSDRS